jgi:hypothetical protein
MSFHLSKPDVFPGVSISGLVPTPEDKVEHSEVLKNEIPARTNSSEAFGICLCGELKGALVLEII